MSSRVLLVAFVLISIDCGPAEGSLDGAGSALSALRWNILSGGDIGADPPPGSFYRYAPAAIQTDANHKELWWCGNRVAGVVRDHIIHRTLSLSPWSWTPESVALCPGRGKASSGCSRPESERYAIWDGEHVCDPEIVGGSFRMSGVFYDYAMFYLGAHKARSHACMTNSDCTSPYWCDGGACVVDQNAVGVAFSRSLPVLG